VRIALNLRISSADEKMNCGTSVARNSFISIIENFQPGQECGPKEKVIKFARPGWFGGRAVLGRQVHRSGLVCENQSANTTTLRRQGNALEDPRVLTPHVRTEVQSFDGYMDEGALADDDALARMDESAIAKDDGARYGYRVCLGSDADSPMDGWAESQRLTNDGIKIRQGIDSVGLGILRIVAVER
jgi:hypothetical protein